jgi:hypothetical protein
MTEPTPPQEFPGGTEARPYRWAFQAWLILFLGLVCLGFINYLGTMFHNRF